LLDVQIKAVTFDVGGTLIEPWPSVGHIYAEVAARHGLKNLSAGALNTRFRAAWKARLGFAHSRFAWAELVDEVFAGLIPDAPSRTFFAALYERFAEANAWRIFEDVIPALDSLATHGIKLGVISNWDERLRPLLRSLNLDQYFEMFAISYEVGVCKPSAAIFNHAADKLGFPAGDILHVGDSLELDVTGAKAAGFHSLRIDRAAGQPDELRSLAELPAKMGQLPRLE
jgi:putative hydrolase of the HAD superfamily